MVAENYEMRLKTELDHHSAMAAKYKKGKAADATGLSKEEIEGLKK